MPPLDHSLYYSGPAANYDEYLARNQAEGRAEAISAEIAFLEQELALNDRARAAERVRADAAAALTTERGGQRGGALRGNVAGLEYVRPTPAMASVLRDTILEDLRRDLRFLRGLETEEDWEANRRRGQAEVEGYAGPPPASKETIEALPEKSTVDALLEGGLGVRCVVCQEEIAFEDVLTSLPCEHWFHNDCIRSWLGHNGTCPLCRNPVEGVENGREEEGLEEGESRGHMQYGGPYE